jgi:hypothetical protein
MRSRKPVIAIPADRRLLGPHWFHCVGEKYIAAIAEGSGAVPVLIPALGEQHLEDWLDDFDGIMFTGSASNVEPHRYQGPPSDPGTWHDPERDATTLPMIPAAIAAGLPVLPLAARSGRNCRKFLATSITARTRTIRWTCNTVRHTRWSWSTAGSCAGWVASNVLP